MRITFKILSKDALVELLSALHTERPFPDELFVALYRRDLQRQLASMHKKLVSLEKELKRGKLPVRMHNAKVKEYERLATIGNKKIAILKELGNAAEE